MQKNGPDLNRWLPSGVIGTIRDTSSCAVSFSGGVDSSAVLAIAARIMGPERIHAVTFSSWFHPERELERAKTFAEGLGVTHTVLPGPELKLPEVIRNHPERCAHCKKARIDRLMEYIEDHSLERIFEGSNADDLKDPTRLGTRILKDLDRGYSPLAEAGLTKRAVRELARALDIPWWNESATACLATRFPLCEELAEEKLKTVGELEEDIRAQGFPQVRLRVFRDLACLEIPEEQMDMALAKRQFLVSLIRKEGFSRVVLDLDGYSSGRKWL
jgi:uncharacterized protein